jgi:hypothetical protein
MSGRSGWWLVAYLVAFLAGVGACLWWGHRQQQPLLAQIRALRPRVQAQQLRNAQLLAEIDSVKRARPPIILPPARLPVIDPPLPPSDAGAAAWRGVAMDARAALAVEREARDRAERHWAEYGERARKAEAERDSVKTELASSDSLLTEQAAALRKSETVVEASPRSGRAWLTITAEALAIVQGGRLSSSEAEAGPGRWQVGGRILAVEAAIGPGKWQVIGRAESATGTGERLAVGVRRAIRVF